MLRYINFVHRHYLFQETNSFPRAKLEENCEPLGTDTVQEQISEHILTSHWGYCVYYASNIYHNTKIREYHADIP